MKLWPLCYWDRKGYESFLGIFSTPELAKEKRDWFIKQWKVSDDPLESDFGIKECEVDKHIDIP